MSKHAIPNVRAVPFTNLRGKLTCGSSGVPVCVRPSSSSSSGLSETPICPLPGKDGHANNFRQYVLGDKSVPAAPPFPPDPGDGQGGLYSIDTTENVTGPPSIATCFEIALETSGPIKMQITVTDHLGNILFNTPYQTWPKISSIVQRFAFSACGNPGCINLNMQVEDTGSSSDIAVFQLSGYTCEDWNATPFLVAKHGECICCCESCAPWPSELGSNISGVAPDESGQSPDPPIPSLPGPSEIPPTPSEGPAAVSSAGVPAEVSSAEIPEVSSLQEGVSSLAEVSSAEISSEEISSKEPSSDKGSRALSLGTASQLGSSSSSTPSSSSSVLSSSSSLVLSSSSSVLTSSSSSAALLSSGVAPSLSSSSCVFRWTQGIDGWASSLAPSATDAQFGWDVAVRGDILAVGAPGEDSGAGAVYVFEWDGSRWELVIRLQHTSVSAGDNFGESVALGEANGALWLAVGAPKTTQGADADAGAVYMYYQTFGSWSSYGAALTASVTNADDRFGDDVSLDSDTVAIVASGYDVGGTNGAGAVYIFDYADPTWSQQSIETLSDVEANAGLISVSLEGDRFVCGAINIDGAVNTSEGKAYVFDKSGGSWSETQKLTPSAGEHLGNFGWEVSLSGDWVGVTDPNYKLASVRTGCVYMWELVSTTWTEQQILTAFPADASTPGLGLQSVSLLGSRVLGGYEDYDDNGGKTTPGAAFIWDLVGGTWTEYLRLLQDPQQNNPDFGQSVALGSILSTAVVSADNYEKVDGDGNFRGRVDIWMCI